MFNAFFESLAASFSAVWGGVAAFVPHFVAAVLLVFVGSILADLVGKLVRQILSAIRLDQALRSVGLEDYVRRAGMSLDSGAFFGALVKWFLVVVFLVQALGALGLTSVTLFLSNVAGYLPQVSVAAFVLLAGLVVGEVMEGVVSAGARLTSLGRANFLGSVCRWAIWIFSSVVALYQLGVTAVFSETVLNAVVMSMALAAGLAFGLGGQSAAAQFLARLRGDLTDHK